MTGGLQKTHTLEQTSIVLLYSTSYIVKYHIIMNTVIYILLYIIVPKQFVCILHINYNMNEPRSM